ncbi:MAG: AraC family transcriptional regulator [Polyangiales bacterium]
MCAAPEPLVRESAVFVWADRALFVGNRSETDMHSHHATELSVALDDLGIEIGGRMQPALRGVCGAVVRAGAEHRLAIPGPKIAVLYVDPQSAIAASLHEWLGDEELRVLPEASASEARRRLGGLLSAAETSLADARAICDVLISTFATESIKPTVDHRVRRVMQRIDTELDAPPGLDDLAASVGISPSRLRHVFREQVGLPISRYALWMRLRTALVEALEGAPMTRAAQTAGFSDAAHFTRTCHQMFGLPPTAFAPVDHVLVE